MDEWYESSNMFPARIVAIAPYSINDNNNNNKDGESNDENVVYGRDYHLFYEDGDMGRVGKESMLRHRGRRELECYQKLRKLRESYGLPSFNNTPISASLLSSSASSSSSSNRTVRSVYISTQSQLQSDTTTINHVMENAK